MPDSSLAALISDGPAGPFRPRHKNFEQPYERLQRILRAGMPVFGICPIAPKANMPCGRNRLYDDICLNLGSAP